MPTFRRVGTLLLALVVALGATPALAAPGVAPPADQMDDRVLVWVVDDADPTDVLAAHGLAVEAGVQPGMAVRAVSVPPGTAGDWAARLGADPRVAAATPDIHLQALRVPNDPAWPAQWGPRQVRADLAWEVTVGRRGPVVAVVDSGVDTHADLPAAALVPGYNALDGSSRTADEAFDKHGTAVATVIAARGDNAIGTAGYCWTCRIMPIKVLNESQGGLFELISGVRWAARNGADVINLSLVIGDRPIEQQPWSPALLAELEAAFDDAEQRGAVVVAAAGNHGTTDRYYPAALPTVVSVAATTPTGARASYSGHGSGVDLAAPGCHVIVPVAASEFCGTSSAAPAVAGAAALLRAVDPTLTPAQIRTLLNSTAREASFVRHGLLDVLAPIDQVLPRAATAAATPIRGDFTGDGVETPGWFRDGVFYLRLRPGGGPPDLVIPYGRPGDLPLVGDWNASGRDTIGVVRDGRWYLTNQLAAGPGTIEFTYGRVTQGDIPLVGDWNGDGRHTIGIVRQGEWHLRDALAGGQSDTMFIYGRVLRGDVPVIGDWNGNGRDTVGIVRGATWYLRDALAGGSADRIFDYGSTRIAEQRLVGDFTGDGRSSPALVRNQTWLVRNVPQAGVPDRVFRHHPWR